MALSFSAVGTFAAANNASVTPTMPGSVSPRPGTLILINAYGRGSGTLVAPAGYSAAFNVQYTTSATSTQAVFYKIANGDEADPTVTYTGGSAGDDVIAAVIVVTGADTIAPIPQVGATSPNGSASNIGPITGITVAANNAVVFVGGRRDDWTSVATLGASGGFTYTEIDDTSISTGGNDAGMVWDYSINGGSPAATGSKTYTVTGGSANPGGGVAFEIAVEAIGPFSKAVAASTDDASLMAFTGYQETDTAMLVGAVGSAGVTNSGQGWRFTGITVPKGSTCTRAFLIMKKSGADFISLSCRWGVVQEDNSPTSSSGNPFGSRAISTNIAAGDDGGNMADLQMRDFPNSYSRQATLGAAFTELFARGGWSSGNAAVVFCNSKQDASQETGFGRANFKTYDNAAGDAATLYLYYTAPASASYVPRVIVVPQAVMRAATR